MCFFPVYFSGHLVCGLYHGGNDQWEDAFQRKRLYPFISLWSLCKALNPQRWIYAIRLHVLIASHQINVMINDKESCLIKQWQFYLTINLVQRGAQKAVHPLLLLLGYYILLAACFIFSFYALFLHLMQFIDSLPCLTNKAVTVLWSCLETQFSDCRSLWTQTHEYEPTRRSNRF